MTVQCPPCQSFFCAVMAQVLQLLFELCFKFIQFDKRKQNRLQALQLPDKSPKGGLDAPIRELVEFINRLPNYVSTSSCSGNNWQTSRYLFDCRTNIYISK